MGLGPCMVNTQENVGRLFVQAGPTTNVNNETRTRWLIYNFNPTQSDYSDFTNFQIGSYQPTELKSISAATNLAVSDDWKIYAMYEKYPNALSNPETSVGLLRYDIHLNEIARSSHDVYLFKINDAASGDRAYIKREDAKFIRPSIMSNHDVFLTTGEYLYHSNLDMGISQHGNNAFYDVSDAFDDRVFALRSNGKLYARRFDVPKHKWVWDKHGRPIKGKHWDHLYRFGSLRKFNNGVLFAIAPKWKNDKNFRIYHRWQDEDGDWHWADHGYPGSEDVTEIGPAYDDKFFIKVASGKLYERHWNANIQDWAWEDHGFA